MNYNVYCTNHRDYALHYILDDKEGENQMITCSLCGHEQQRVILGSRVAASKPLYDQYEEQQKHAE